MVTEIAILQIKPMQNAAFEKAFSAAQNIISSKGGYINHQLQKCLEADNKYLLIVNWETLEAHTDGFRKSEAYKEWKALLHHFYEPFPTVEHYYKIF